MKKEQFVELTSDNGEESVVVINVKHITHMNEWEQGVVVIMTSIPTKLGNSTRFFVTESIQDILVQIRCDK
tara:strand:- start:738 stop:950 length:213 start_codon:yes stop_codon:yes gene_type:complete